ncbi:MAG TPA: hypothetical protein VIA61_18405 [Methylomirabilota bacterium]|jgi:hypothetical protein
MSWLLCTWMSTALQPIAIEVGSAGRGLTAEPSGPILGAMSTITTKEGTRNGPITRRGVLVGTLALLGAAAGARPVRGAAKPTISVHKSPT